MADQSSLASILRNLRDAAVDFSKPYQTPGTIPAALRDLLAQLGIADSAPPFGRSWKTP
jgi:hypothetical protein